MKYESDDVLNMLKIYQKVESEAKDFLYLASFPTKNKDPLIKAAEKTLVAIEEYKRIPLEIRNKLENDKKSYVYKLIELEKVCKEALDKKEK